MRWHAVARQPDGLDGFCEWLETAKIVTRVRPHPHRFVAEATPEKMKAAH
jgi:hypothetical protein